MSVREVYPASLFRVTWKVASGRIRSVRPKKKSKAKRRRRRKREEEEQGEGRRKG